MAKIILRRLFSFLLIVAFIASIFMYPDWYKKQVNKVKGMYYVAQGDKQLRKQNFQKAINLYYAEYVKVKLTPDIFSESFNNTFPSFVSSSSVIFTVFASITLDSILVLNTSLYNSGDIYI